GVLQPRPPASPETRCLHRGLFQPAAQLVGARRRGRPAGRGPRDGAGWRVPPKLADGAARAVRLVKEIWVVPGARRSSRSIAHELGSPRSAMDTFCNGRPPSMICSVLASIRALIGARGISAIRPSIADIARAGAATLPSLAS